MNERIATRVDVELHAANVRRISSEQTSTWTQLLQPRSFFLSFFLSIFLSFFLRLISAAADWMSTILRHMVWP